MLRDYKKGIQEAIESAEDWAKGANENDYSCVMGVVCVGTAIALAIQELTAELAEIRQGLHGGPTSTSRS